jgi:hypothetical protein
MITNSNVTANESKVGLTKVLTYNHEDAFITWKMKVSCGSERLRRDVGVAPTKYVDDFHGNLPL